MAQFYELTTAGTPPVSLETAKEYLRIPNPSSKHPDDDLLTLLLKMSAEDAERYTGRDFRINTWTLLIDEFEDRICLNRDPVDSITSVARLVSGSFSTVSSDVYYQKKSTQLSEILLNDGETWPTDQDDIEAAIKIIFATAAHRHTDQARAAILRHVVYLYEHRGDCEPTLNVDALEQSGAAALLLRIRIARV